MVFLVFLSALLYAGRSSSLQHKEEVEQSGKERQEESGKSVILLGIERIGGTWLGWAWEIGRRGSVGAVVILTSFVIDSSFFQPWFIGAANVSVNVTEFW